MSRAYSEPPATSIVTRRTEFLVGTTAKGKYKGQRADMAFIYTRVWVKRDGPWQAVAAHASLIPATE
jgi:hypothetical protein